MPIKRRKEGSYQVTVGYGGRTLRRSSRHWTHADARNVEADLLRQVREAHARKGPEHTLAQGLEKWLKEHAPKLRSAKEARSKARMLLPHIAGRPLNEAPQVWSEIKTKLHGKSPSTINHQGRLLRQICNLALTEWGWTNEPIGKRIKLLPETPREAFLTLEQVDALAKAAGGKAGELILFAAYTGIRFGHMMRLTQRDIRDGWITLDRTSKNRTLQQVPIHPRIEAVAKALPLGIGEWPLRVAWDKARKECGLEAVRWHDLRHTCASWLVQAGVPIYTVKDFLGHSSVAVTQRYAKLAPVHLREAILKLA